MSKPAFYLLGALALFISSPLFAAENNKAMCEKIKECTLQELDKQQMPPEMKTMMVTMFDAQCATMLTQQEEKIADAGLSKQANACVDSVVAMSCDALVKTQGQPTTSECKEFEKAANDAGISLDAS